MAEPAEVQTTKTLPCEGRGRPGSGFRLIGMPSIDPAGGNQKEKDGFMTMHFPAMGASAVRRGLPPVMGKGFPASPRRVWWNEQAG